MKLRDLSSSRVLAAVQHWDWKGQPDIEEMKWAAKKLLIPHRVPDTGSDSYAILWLSYEETDEDMIQRLYDKYIDLELYEDHQ